MELFDLIEPGDMPTSEQTENALILIPIINEFENILDKKLHCNSGIRSVEKQLEIYAKLRIEDAAAGKPIRSIPMGSAHLKGNAVDISCPTMPIKLLQQWFLEEAQLELAENLGLWFENFDYTPRWIHAQRVPPASGNRFFIP